MKLMISASLLDAAGKDIVKKNLQLEDELDGIEHVLRDTDTLSQFFNRFLAALENVPPEDTAAERPVTQPVLLEDYSGTALQTTTAKTTKVKK
jgi:hypothetical protein